jgi:outer membrane protein OmpA-like peptidoglycan-associated protein
MILRQSIVACAIALIIAGCAANDPHRRAKTGAAIGGVAGAVTGAILGDGKGAVVGGAVGAMSGAAIGDYMDKQQKAFDEALAEEQRQNEIEIERMKDESLKLSLNNEVSFDFGKADIKPAFEPSLAKLTDVLQKYNRTTVRVVGHTDSIGSEESNQRLSERRAQAVTSYLASHGIPSSRLSSEGRGEREPRDTNDTEAGRALNRRVEIYVKPIVEGGQQAARVQQE